MSVFADDMTIYLEDPIISAQNILKMISIKWSIFPLHPLSSSPSISAKSQDTKSMCRNHKHSYTPTIESQIMSKCQFTIATKRVKYLGLQLTKKVKDLFKENYKPLLNEIREDTDGETFHAHGLGSMTIFMILILPK